MYSNISSQALIPTNRRGDHWEPSLVIWGFMSMVGLFSSFKISSFTLPYTDDQSAYLLFASDNNQNFKIARMNDNYYDVTTQVAVLSGELPKRNKLSLVYLFRSQEQPWSLLVLSRRMERTTFSLRTPQDGLPTPISFSNRQYVHFLGLLLIYMIDRYLQSLSGTWSSESDLATSSTRTYYSQNTFDLPLGSNGLYMGDRWRYV